MLSRNQIDKLGRRLRDTDQPTDEDLALFIRYQDSLQSLYSDTREQVAAIFAEVLPNVPFEPSFRRKQLVSAVAKLRREPMALSTMQDLIGFRVTVPTAVEQEKLRVNLPADWRVYDRRQRPSHGYRAVHVVRRTPAGSVEVQIRTQLQHLWAEFSELLDRHYPGMKHGEGSGAVRFTLDYLSEHIAAVEAIELDPRPQRVEYMVERKERIILLLEQFTQLESEGRL